MKKILILSVLLFSFMAKTSAQTTIHGQAEPVELYHLVDGAFYKILTSDIWVYADESYGVNTPYTLVLSTPPTFGGEPLGNFKPIPCGTAKGDYGRPNVKCGPYNVFVVGGQFVQSCGNTNEVTCQIKWRSEGKDYVVWNPDIN